MNITVARKGGSVARNARLELEQSTGRKVVTPLNAKRALQIKEGKNICDMLAGKYPKDFKFTGWHPQCYCNAVPILKTIEEMQADNERIMNGEQVVNESTNSVSNVPDEFNKWLTDNEGRLAKSKSSPYFITDNPKYTGVVPRIGAVGAYAGTKLGRTATKAAYKEYEIAEVTKINEMQKANINNIANDLKAKAVPMSFFEADEGRANVNYKPRTIYADNCQICVLVHETRLRGINSTSLGYDYSIGSVSERLSVNSAIAWTNPKTGKLPAIRPYKGMNDSDRFAWIKEQTKAEGRYHIGVNIDQDNGHIFTAERLKNGKLICYDPQRNEFLKIEELVGVESFEVLKVDKLLINKDIFITISELL